MIVLLEKDLENVCKAKIALLMKIVEVIEEWVSAILDLPITEI